MKLVKATQTGKEVEYVLEIAPKVEAEFDALGQVTTVAVSAKIERKQWTLKDTWKENEGAQELTGQAAIDAQIAMHKREIKNEIDAANVAPVESDISLILP